MGTCRSRDVQNDLKERARAVRMMLLLYVERAVVVLLAAVALLLAIVSFRQASGSTVAFLQCCGFGIRCFFDPGFREG